MTVGITERGDAGINFDEFMNSIRNNPDLEFIVAITKAPHILLQNLESLPKNLIIHCTITGWGGTTTEPNVVSPRESLAAYYSLVYHLGPKRVVLRIDPIIPTNQGIIAAEFIASKCQSRLRISILDFYNHVVMRYKSIPSISKELEDLYQGNLHLNSPYRQHILSKFKNAEICGEPGFPSVGCISLLDYDALGLPHPIKIAKNKQRQACCCLSSKKELLTNKQPCFHGCLYCYWK